MVVGDIVYLYIGDIVLVDGIFIYGYNLMIDESGLIGESESVYVDDENSFFLLGIKV